MSGFLSAKGDEYLEELLQLQASMASKVDWVDEWPTPAPEPPVSAADVKPSGVDLLGERASNRSASETTGRRQRAPEAQRATQKTKRKREKQGRSEREGKKEKKNERERKEGEGRGGGGVEGERGGRGRGRGGWWAGVCRDGLGLRKGAGVDPLFFVFFLGFNCTGA